MNAAAAARIEDKIFARFALHKMEKLTLRFFQALYRLDPQALAIWETSKYIEFVIHRPSLPIEFLARPSRAIDVPRGPLKFDLAKSLYLRAKKRVANRSS